jgi:hypothetical protein
MFIISCAWSCPNKRELSKQCHTHKLCGGLLSPWKIKLNMPVRKNMNGIGVIMNHSEKVLHSTVLPVI